jgi:hypothetical protein
MNHACSKQEHAVVRSNGTNIYLGRCVDVGGDGADEQCAAAVIFNELEMRHLCLLFFYGA